MTEFVARLCNLIDEYTVRHDPDGQPVNVLAMAMRSSPTDPTDDA